MDKKNRSEVYDWFKKGTPKSQKSNKEKFAQAWKYFKIVIIFCLFGFSMVGCVQTFFIKTSNSVTKGVEIYDSKKSISPLVKTFSYGKKEFKLKNNESVSLYNINIDKNPDFIISKKDNKSLVNKINYQFKNQNVNYSNYQKNQGSLAIGEVKKGHFESVRIVPESNKNQSKILLDKNGDPLILSSASSYEHSQFDNIKDEIEIIWPYTDGKKPIVYQEKKLKIDLKNFYYGNSFSIPKQGTKNSARLSYIRKIINQLVDSYIKKTPTNESVNYNTLIKQDANNFRPVLNQHFKNTANILQDYGFRISTIKTGQNKGDATAKWWGYMDSETNYIPLATWSDAWKLGPFYGLFVFPIGFVSESILGSFPLISGWEALLTIFIIVFTLRIFSFLVTYKSSMQQVAMQELQGKKAIIDAKYEPYKDNKQMKMRKNQEIQALYKKEGINPFSVFSSMFVQMPIFLSMWRVIGASQTFKTTIWAGINFSATSWQELIYNGDFIYLPLMIVTVLSQLVSQLLPRYFANKRNKKRINIHQKEAMKKNNRTQNIMMVVFIFIGLTFSAGLQIYWIVGSIWTIIQSFASDKLMRREKEKRKKAKNYIKI